MPEQLYMIEQVINAHKAADEYINNMRTNYDFHGAPLYPSNFEASIDAAKNLRGEMSRILRYYRYGETFGDTPPQEFAWLKNLGEDDDPMVDGCKTVRRYVDRGEIPRSECAAARAYCESCGIK